MGNKRPIFVIGSPRSGSTLIGNYIGTCRDVRYVGESINFAYTIYDELNRDLKRAVPLLEANLTERNDLQNRVINSALDWLMNTSESKYICDSTPWTTILLDNVTEYFSDPIFVICLRHYSGVIASLKRSYESGYKWAGEDDIKRASLWVQFYRRILDANLKNSIIVNYDLLCMDPNRCIEKLNLELSRFDLDVSSLDLSVFCNSYTNNKARVTIGKYNGGKVQLEPISSIEQKNWTKKQDELVYPIVGEVHSLLMSKFKEDYIDLIKS